VPPSAGPVAKLRSALAQVAYLPAALRIVWSVARGWSVAWLAILLVQGMVPAGMANRCVMLRQGYLEFLTAVSDTELSRRFNAAVGRYIGLHLIALSVADADTAHSRLAEGGFNPDPPVHLRRPVEAADGRPAEAAFTVLRVPPDSMPEGRIQMLAHHTEEVVWQPRWLEHANGVTSLEAVLIAVDDPGEAAARFGRFAGGEAKRGGAGRRVLALERGVLVFADATEMSEAAPWAGRPPAVPWIAGYALGSPDPERTGERFTAAGLSGEISAPGETAYVLPPALGGFVTVAAPGSLPSWAG
jgi:hypothetical protein